jgi:hypothetical protein
VRQTPETRFERWTRLWHLHRQDVRTWAAAVLLAAIVIVFLGALKSGLRSLYHQVETSRWWDAISPQARNCVAGSLAAVSGLLLLRGTWKQRRGISSFLDLQVFVAEGALTVVGVVLVLKGLGVI